ncbi:MAG: transcriptional regulator [Anaerolineae bacterium]|nr:transcriptional regulator [Anaerolineae bacterium]
MSFSDSSGSLANRLRKARAQNTPPEKSSPDRAEQLALRARILGVLIRDARLARNRTAAACATSLGVDEQTLLNWEYGLEQPSLPQLELLAYDLGVPISHFWGTTTFAGEGTAHVITREEYLILRDRVVGAQMRRARTEAGLSLDDLSHRVGIPVELLDAYELGQISVPLSELTTLASALNVSLNTFLEASSRVGRWLALQEEFHRFSQLPEDIRHFVSNPTNRSFLQLAMWFSALKVDELRGIAESILHLSRLEAGKMRQIAESILNDITL